MLREKVAGLKKYIKDNAQDRSNLVGDKTTDRLKISTDNLKEQRTDLAQRWVQTQHLKRRQL